MSGVLLVDDSLPVLTLLEKLVKLAGCEVVAKASSGEEAIVKYQETLPDLVIMDINMGKIDGLTALQKIKSWDQQSCVVMCTCEKRQDQIQEALDLGAADYILKPFHIEQVIQCIQTQIKIKAR